MSEIVEVHGRQVWDSRGRPTVEVEVSLASGATGRAIAPSGASTGSREALDRRDGGKRLGGYGVNGAIAAVNGEIATRLTGLDAPRPVGMRRRADRARRHRRRRPASAATPSSPPPPPSPGPPPPSANIPLWQHLRTLAGLDARRGPHPRPDDPDFRRRPPCRQPHRHPGLPGARYRREKLRRGHASGSPKSISPPASPCADREN